MAVDLLSSRAVRGMFYEELEIKRAVGWVDAISNFFTSDQEMETYGWLSQAPLLREWLDGRQPGGLTENQIEIINKQFEASLEFRLKDLRRDKSGQVAMRIGELVDRSQTHWMSLLSQLIENGEDFDAYNGKKFFAADHEEGDSGTMKNLLTASEYAVLNVATPAAPTSKEMADAIIAAVSHFYTFKDDKGEPRNEEAMQFVVMVPITMIAAAQSAVSAKTLDTGAGTVDNPLFHNDWKVSVSPNARLTWTTDFAVFRADARVKPFIRQSETEIDLKVLAEGSDLEYNHSMWSFGIDCWRNVGPGMYSQAIKAKLS